MRDYTEMEHLRYHVELEPEERLWDGIQVLIDITPILEDSDCVEGWYYFWETFHEDFEHHLQIDVLFHQHPEDALEELENTFKAHHKDYTGPDETEDKWVFGLGEVNNVMLQGHIEGARMAARHLIGKDRGGFQPEREPSLREATPRNMVGRRWHLIANQHGLDRGDERKLAFQMWVRSAVLHYLGPRVYKWLFR